MRQKGFHVPMNVQRISTWICSYINMNILNMRLLTTIVSNTENVLQLINCWECIILANCFSIDGCILNNFTAELGDLSFCTFVKTRYQEVQVWGVLKTAIIKREASETAAHFTQTAQYSCNKDPYLHRQCYLLHWTKQQHNAVPVCNLRQRADILQSTEVWYATQHL